MKKVAFALAVIAAAACSRLENVGKAPTFTPIDNSVETQAMQSVSSGAVARAMPHHTPSLWTGARGSLLGDRRAGRQGDILTVVIEIDESAEISNSSSRSRNGSESMTSHAPTTATPCR